MNLNFFKNDWDKIPQNYRYILLSGGFFILNAWLLDHWSNVANRFNNLFDTAFFSYWIGLVIIIIGIVVIVAKQIRVFWGILSLRRKFSYDKLNKHFYIYSFKGKWYLFDKKEKKYRHIHPWTTVSDLGIEGWETYLEYNFKANTDMELPIKGSNTTLNPRTYTAGKPINTQN